MSTNLVRFNPTSVAERTGNAEEMRNTTAVAMASGRSHRDRGLPVKGGAMKLVGRPVGSVAIAYSRLDGFECFRVSPLKVIRRNARVI